MTSNPNPVYLAARLHAPGDLRIESVPFETLGAGEVRVQIGAATTCGTDRKTFARGHPVLIKSYPSRIGHEMAGTISEVGAHVREFKEGDRVVIPNSAPCLNCFFCKKQNPNLCENLIFLNGAYAQYIVVPEQIVKNNLHKISDHLEFAKAALTEPLACVIHALEHMHFKSGETVAIVGTGPMAFFFVQLIAKAKGTSLVVGRNPGRLELLKTAGANLTINSNLPDWADQLKAITGGHGVDLAVEAVGQPELWAQTFNLVRPGGRVCLYGGCKQDTTFTLDTYRLHYQEITVSGVFHHTPETIKKAIALLTNNQINTDILLHDVHPLEDLPQILASVDKNQPFKSVIVP